MSYAAFERAHMRREEQEILPLALEVLTNENWKEIVTARAFLNAAFVILLVRPLARIS